MFNEIINGITHDEGKPYIISFSAMGVKQSVTFKDKTQMKQFINCKLEDIELNDIFVFGDLYDEEENCETYDEMLSGKSCIDVDMTEITLKDFRKKLANKHWNDLKRKKITKMDDVHKKHLKEMIQYKTFDMIFKHNIRKEKIK